MAEPLVNTINTPNTNNTIMIGNNQNFLRAFKKAQRSLKNSMIKILLY